MSAVSSVAGSSPKTANASSKSPCPESSSGFRTSLRYALPSNTGGWLGLRLDQRHLVALGRDGLGAEGGAGLDLEHQRRVHGDVPGGHVEGAVGSHREAHVHRGALLVALRDAGEGAADED